MSKTTRESKINTDLKKDVKLAHAANRKYPEKE